MNQITFIKRLCRNEFSSNSANFNFDIEIPCFCPICNFPQCGTPTERKLWNVGSQKYYGTVMYTCNHCLKKYLVIYDLDVNKKEGHFKCFYPFISDKYENSLLEPISPRFINLYNQALRSENVGDIDLASTGYRDALECLVKDFAIKELNADPEDVKKKSLCDALGDYLETDLTNTGDVVRILGNDLTHYERKYPNLDFDVLKDYLAIFITLIETKIKIMHPPVSR